MKPEYEKYKKELIDKERKHYLNGNELTDKDILRNKCQQFSKAFVEKFPHLKTQAGFVCLVLEHHLTPETLGVEHIWCKDIDGTIVDPTSEQFRDGTSALFYTEFDETKHEIRLGTCPNCGGSIFGLKNEARSFCDDDCQTDYENYMNGLIR